MKLTEQYEAHFATNRESWNQRTAVHLASSFYNNQAFIAGKSSLNSPELALLGDLDGRRILHLQCHFGQDSISLARLGAQVTAVDLSPDAIKAARELNEQCGQSVRFIECNIYDLRQHLQEQFDTVFISYGTITWLPDLNEWARIIAEYLRPGGQLVFVEFHPLCWIYDNDFQKITYSYFNEGPLHFTDKGSYTDGAEEEDFTYVAWNQPLSDVLTALLQAGLQLQTFQEYDYTPYDVFPDLVEAEPGKYRFRSLERKFPFLYSLTALKP